MRPPHNAVNKVANRSTHLSKFGICCWIMLVVGFGTIVSGCVGAVPSTFPTMRNPPTNTPSVPSIPSPSGSPSSTPSPTLPSPNTSPSIPQPPSSQSTIPSIPTPSSQPSSPTRPTLPTVRQGSQGGNDRSSSSDSGQQDSRRSRSGGSGGAGESPSLPGLPQLPPLEPSGNVIGGQAGGGNQTPTGSSSDSSQSSDGWIRVVDGEDDARSDSAEGTGDGAGQQGDPTADPDEAEQSKQGPSPEDQGGTKQSGQAGSNSPGEVVGPDSEMRPGGGLHGSGSEDEWETSNELPDPAQSGDEDEQDEEEGSEQADGDSIDEELGQILSVLDGEIQEEREEQNATAGGIPEGELLPSDENLVSGEGTGTNASGEDQIVVGGTSTEEIPTADNKRTSQVEPSELPERPKVTSADIPDAKDDDVIARQLREAAMAETDPKLRESLWEELRIYKGGKK